MSDRAELTFTILNGGTASDVINIPGGMRLVALITPTLTNTAINFKSGRDPAAMQDLYDSGGTLAALGAASVGARVFAMPSAVKDASQAGFIQLVVAAQGAARTVVGICEHIG